MALTHEQRLEALYGLTADTLGLDARTYPRRVNLWAQLARQHAATPGLTPTQADALVEVYALRAWQTALIGKADKFRAEGDVTVERDTAVRLTRLGEWISAAERAAGLTPPATASAVTANPTPLLQGWGLGND